jgi:WD40 repeat protein
MLIQLYAGNPLALKLISEPIRELFNANIDAFLKEEQTVVGNIHELLDQQFQRLPAHERDLMYWLAIEREAVTLETLWEDTVSFISKKALLNALASLKRRSIIETSDTAQFTLQPVIMEYVTDEFTRHISDEIHAETASLLASHALLKAQAKEYVRETQVRLILIPIIERLLARLTREELEQKCKALLASLSETSSQKPTYAAGNLLNLLIHMRYDLRGYDFSRLSIRQAFLQGKLLPEVNFAYADLATSVFTDTFGSILAVAFHPDGNVVAAGTASGEVRLWDAASGMPLHTCRGHMDWVRSVAFRPDGQMLASGSEDQTVKLWDV